MAVTSLDSRTALIVIDLQTATAWFATAHPVRDVVRNAVQLTRTFRRHEFARSVFPVAEGTIR
jgi:nicotinamidase-related amidase